MKKDHLPSPPQRSKIYPSAGLRKYRRLIRDYKYPRQSFNLHLQERTEDLKKAGPSPPFECCLEIMASRIQPIHPQHRRRDCRHSNHNKAFLT